MKFEDLPISERKALKRLALKKSPRLIWHLIFVTFFSIFTAAAITSALYPKHEDINSLGYFFTRAGLGLGFIYWGHLSILQPRIMQEIEKIINAKNGAQ